MTTHLPGFLAFLAKREPEESDDRVPLRIEPPPPPPPSPRPPEGEPSRGGFEVDFEVPF